MLRNPDTSRLLLRNPDTSASNSGHYFTPDLLLIVEPNWTQMIVKSILGVRETSFQYIVLFLIK